VKKSSGKKARTLLTFYTDILADYCLGEEQIIGLFSNYAHVLYNNNVIYKIFINKIIIYIHNICINIKKKVIITYYILSPE